jgi:hypothetical protein
MSAEPVEIESTLGTEGLGLLFMEAMRTGVAELGIIAVVAAPTLNEKGQSALTRAGKSVAAVATSRNPTRNFIRDPAGEYISCFAVFSGTTGL